MVGEVRAAKMSSRVDFPAPLGPTMARISDGQAVKDTSWRIQIGGVAVQGLKRKKGKMALAMVVGFT